MVQAVLFDMDGLLLDTERVALKAYHHVADDMGLDFDLDGFRQLVGLNAKSGIAKFREVFPDVDHDVFNTAWHVQYELSLAEEIPLRPTVLDALDAIDLPKAVVTSSRRASSLKKLTEAGIIHHFDFIVGGDDVANGKPHPEPYQTGASRLGFLATDCVAFEDSENGTRAAVAAGCVTVQVPDIFEPTPALLELGHLIAPDLLAGARMTGLVK